MEFELLKKWPKKGELFLVAHFGAADFPGLSDVQDIYQALDPVRKTMVSIKKPVDIRYSDRCGNCRKLRVHCYDTLLLTPAKTKSLKDLGSLVGLEKVQLDECVIERMNLLLENDREKFIEYALVDAEISARFFELMREIYFGLNPKAKHLPATLGGIGVKELLRLWEQEAVSSNDVLGLEQMEIQTYKDNRVIKSKKDVPQELVSRHEQFAVETFHGGRNEQFFFGPSEVGEWTD
jgi:hypothetical protein